MKKIILINYSFENGDGLCIDIAMLHEIDKDVSTEDYAKKVIDTLNNDHAWGRKLFTLISVNDSLAADEMTVLKKYLYFYSA